MATKALARRRPRRSNPRGRSRRRSGMTLPLATMAGFAPLIANVIGGFRAGGAEKALDNLSAGLTGYSFQAQIWSPRYALQWGIGPILLGGLVSKFASRLGINRALGRAGVPYLRI